MPRNLTDSQIMDFVRKDSGIIMDSIDAVVQSVPAFEEMMKNKRAVVLIGNHISPAERVFPGGEKVWEEGTTEDWETYTEFLDQVIEGIDSEPVNLTWEEGNLFMVPCEELVEEWKKSYTPAGYLLTGDHIMGYIDWVLRFSYPRKCAKQFNCTLTS